MECVLVPKQMSVCVLGLSGQHLRGWLPCDLDTFSLPPLGPLGLGWDLHWGEGPCED